MLAALLLAATATMVVPSFEVSIEPENRNFDTRFTIENTSDELQRARINVWSDHGHPVLWYTIELEPHTTETVSMRDVLVDGKANICAGPGGPIPARLLEAVRCTLTTGCQFDLSDIDLNCKAHVGERHAHAIGYVTVDVVADCMDLTSPNVSEYTAQMRSEQVLNGTFEQIGNGAVLSSGSLMDRAAGPVPQFKMPRSPRDPLARQPPKKCPPLSEMPPQT